MVTRGTAKLDYTMGRPFQETYMVFGANRHRDERADANIVGIPLMVASDIAKRYPDFHRCASPGATEAKHSLRGMLVLSEKRDVRTALQRVAEEHARRIKSNGERLCVRLVGNALAMNSWAKGDQVMSGTQIAGMMPPGAIPQEYFYIEAVEVMDCQRVL